MYALAKALREVLYEASKNFPEGKPGYLKQEWCEIVSKMVIEMVKRKFVPIGKMKARAREATAVHIEERRFQQLLKMKFPEWSRASTAKDEHPKGEDQHHDSGRNLVLE